MNRFRKILIGLGAIILEIIGLIVFNSVSGPKDITVKKEILAGSTFSVLGHQMGMATATIDSILKNAAGIYDFSQIQAGKSIAFIYSPENKLKKLVYDINADEQLIITNAATTTSEFWQISRQPIPYEIKTQTANGVIENSLYQTITSQGLDQRLALALAETFAWQIDFAFNIQKGDSFSVIYEARYRDGKYDSPGKILAAKFINNGETFNGYYFKSDKTPAGYYDEKGFSLQKIFLKFPLQFKYISTYFTYRRVDPVNGNIEPHRAVDFAANYGTPAVAIGDGVVIDAGWRGPYGNKVVIRHNEMYTTTYGHFSSYGRGIKIGAHVRQGQIVGYVGSTGLSTGPHLHYEVRKFGSLVNPLSIKPPDGKPIDPSDQAAFANLIKTFTL